MSHSINYAVVSGAICSSTGTLPRVPVTRASHSTTVMLTYWYGIVPGKAWDAFGIDEELTLDDGVITTYENGKDDNVSRSLH